MAGNLRYKKTTGGWFHRWLGKIKGRALKYQKLNAQNPPDALTQFR